MSWERDAKWEKSISPMWREAGLPLALWPKCYRNGDLSAIVGRENCGGEAHDPLRWHISLAAQGRVPTWAELAQSAHELRPGVFFVVMVPPRSMWMNVHPNVLHLWETADPALAREAQVNALGHEPT